MNGSVEQCAEHWCEQPAGHVTDHSRWLGQWHGRARGNGREVTVQAMLAGRQVPHLEVILVDSGFIADQTVSVLSWPDVDEFLGTLTQARHEYGPPVEG